MLHRILKKEKEVSITDVAAFVEEATPIEIALTKAYADGLKAGILLKSKGEAEVSKEAS